MTGVEHVKQFRSPDYDYGNRTAIEVIRFVPAVGGLDPHGSLDLLPGPEATLLFTEVQLEDTVAELASNYKVVGDPKSTEAKPKQFGMSLANAHLAALGVPAIVIFSSAAGSFYDEDGNVNSADNALEVAYTALKYPHPVVFVEIPGNGNSTGFTDDEYKQAAEDGKLGHDTLDTSGKLVDFEAFETIQAMVRAITSEDITIGYITSNAAGTHVSTAVEAALPEDTLKSSFLYNLTNISDRNGLWAGALTLKEIFFQSKYAKKSQDPLKLTDERKAMARRVMGDAASNIVKRRIQQSKASTHNPNKLKKQLVIFSRGNKRGQSGATQLVAGQMRHKNLKQTVVLPEFASQYKNPEDFVEFMRIVTRLGGQAVQIADLESLSVPLGQYGHTHYPSARQTLESYSFNR